MSTEEVSSEVHVVYVTMPNETAAKELARVLLGEKLVACANIVPQVTSLYEWEGEVREETESVLFMKTQSSRVTALALRVEELHSYEVPCIVSWPLSAGYQPFLDWVQTQTDA